MYYENEEDIGNLYIRKDYSLLDNVRFYTDKEFIYEVSCNIDKKRAKQLLGYIKDIQHTEKPVLQVLFLILMKTVYRVLPTSQALIQLVGLSPFPDCQPAHPGASTRAGGS